MTRDSTVILRRSGFVRVVVILFLTTVVQAQQSFGARSDTTPNEDFYVYKPIPDIQIQTSGSTTTRLSTLWHDKPFLLTMIFTRCTGVCSPFLHSLRAAASDTHALGQDYRIVVLSFDPNDTTTGGYYACWRVRTSLPLLYKRL